MHARRPLRAVYHEAMPESLPRIRFDLDFMPSPIQDRPGLLIRDPFRFSDVTMVVPPPLVPALRCFDGQQTDLDLRQALVQITGELDVSGLQEHLFDSLSHAGFLEDDQFLAMRDQRVTEFAASPERFAAHAGGAYPDDPEELKGLMSRHMQPDGVTSSGVAPIAIAAPHVSPDGGWETYREAYLALQGSAADRVFVVLGTSHYGEPERFGLTRKAYVTPFGATQTDAEIVSWLESRASSAVRMEDYCHAVEHSIEFQIVFLQALYGPDIRVVPILCGPFAHSVLEGGMPEDDDGVKAFLEALGELQQRERDRLTWVLGIDLAHIGTRYGDPLGAQAGDMVMQGIEARDRGRLDRVLAGDAEGYWSMVQEKQDDLKWCGSAPLYTFMRAVPGAQGQLRRYEQWNIDQESVVSFAALSFSRC